jgi:hypothetical protein
MNDDNQTHGIAENKQAARRPGRLVLKESAVLATRFRMTRAGRVRVTNSKPVNSGAELHFKLCS